MRQDALSRGSGSRVWDSIFNWAAMGGNVPSCMCNQRRQKSGYLFALSDQSLHCPPQLCILGYRNLVQRRFWSDCAKAQSDQNLRWAHMSDGTFPDVATYILILQEDTKDPDQTGRMPKYALSFIYLFYFILFIYLFFFFFFFLFSLRKHAYSNILKISPPKTESFQIKILFFFFHISAQNIECGCSARRF